MSRLDETQDAREQAASAATLVPSAQATLAAERSDERPRMRAEPGQRFGRFHTLDKLGEGAMGVVLAAHDEQLDRKVALKFLLRAGGDSLARERLFREARSLARLSHPNIVAVYEVGEIDEVPYLAMELVSGRTLRAWLEGEGETAPGRVEILEMFLALGRGLAAAHELGVVHRDFKPDNVLVGSDGRPRVVDFGLASIGKAAAAIPSPSEVGELGDREPSLTATGSLMGTPAYMAAEQWSGLPADARSDQFAFCVALFEALYGRPPFAGDTVPEIMSAVLDGEPDEVPVTDRVPAALHQAIVRGLAREPQQRWTTLSELLEQIELALAQVQPGLFTTPPKQVFAVALPVLFLLPLTLLGLELGRVIDYRPSNWAWLSTLQVTLMGGGAYLLRDLLRRHVGDPRMLVGPAFLVSLILGHRLIAVATGTSFEAMFAYDFLALLALSCVIVLVADRRLLPVLAVPLGLLTIALVQPSWAPRSWAAFTMLMPPAAALALLRTRSGDRLRAAGVSKSARSRPGRSL